jgi:hypothetical protein
MSLFCCNAMNIGIGIGLPAGGGGIVGGLWTPADITTQAWFDASDASTIT